MIQNSDAGLTEYVLEGTFTPAQEKSYVHLPFEMPADATRLEVTLAYSHRIGSDPMLAGGNTIDLGVFDARGIDFLNAGFRGWTGSERLHFFIDETDATPGYLPGALLAGRWHIVLGLYKLAPEGCTYRVDIKISTGAKQEPAAGLSRPAGELPAAKISPRAGGWLRGELHCHTLHSDGDGTPEEVVAMARERGLDFLAITDHNSIRSQQELEKMREPGLVLVRGTEVTTFKGHLNVWGIGDWVDFRVRSPEDLAAAIRFAVERGAVTTCNHPKPFGPDWEFPEVEGYHCIEVWNGPWRDSNQVSLDFWTRQLAAGKRVVAIGGSDYHRRSQLTGNPPRAPGSPTVWLRVEGAPNESAILNAIRQGHVSLSGAPEGPFLDLRVARDPAVMGGDIYELGGAEHIAVRVNCARGQGHILRLLDQERVLYEQTVTQSDELVHAEPNVINSRLVRAELRSRAGDVRALTNPIYLPKSG